LSLRGSVANVRVPPDPPLFEPAFRGLGLVRSGETAASPSGALMKVL
jgi:hypothetical protein